MRHPKSFSIALFVIALCSFNVGCQQLTNLGNSAIDVLTQRPRNSAVKMEDQYFADERRQGINEVVDRDFGKHPPYTDRYKEIAASDPDQLVRATAIRALNRSRDQSASPVFVKALDDQNEWVRLEACKALVNVPDPNAKPGLLRLLGDPTQQRDIRIAAADALQHHKSLDVARTLIAQLSGREFGLAWQSRRSLKNLTGQDLRYDETAWLNLITGPTKPFG